MEPDDEHKYLAGYQNRLIRYWYYLENGLNILNEFRNLFLGIIALYIALKLSNVAYLFLMFIPCVVLLTVIGYYAVHKVAKVKEWVNLRFSSHFGIRNFDYTKASYELLKDIRDMMIPIPYPLDWILDWKHKHGITLSKEAEDELVALLSKND